MVNMKMVNLTVNETETAIQGLSCNTLGLLDINQRMIISAFNIPLSITAFLGNALIIIALQKPSSLHPSSKLLFGCLAVTDLGVGLVAQPLRVIYLMSPEQSKFCYYAWVLYNTLGLIFSGVSLLTLTVSIERLLALMLGLRYRHVVTLRRVWIVVVSLWLSVIAIVIIIFYNFSIIDFVVCTILLLCIIISTCSYTKTYFTLRKNQAQLQSHTHQERPSGGSSEQSKRSSTPLNIARYRGSVSTALWVQMTLVVRYLPFGVVIALLAITGQATPSIELAWETTIVIVLLNSSLNPFIYCWKVKEIRQAGKETICLLRCCSK